MFGDRLQFNFNKYKNMFISTLQKISGHHRSDLPMGIYSLGKERKGK